MEHFIISKEKLQYYSSHYTYITKTNEESKT